ncbi:Pkinase-domain-containing protein [Lichtheimia hyalospora FSU 10163]|nr:Pkinase-domain-containing protein [Lichtheimia hyalospora FSU 10163]
MTAATLAPPVAAAGNAPTTTTRDPEILPRRTPSVRSNTLESTNDPSLQRHGSTRSQTSALEKRKQQNHDTSSASRRPSERRKVIRIGNYVINRKTIGAGSMGKVKLATCLTDSDRQQYAVKVMPKINLAALADMDTSKAKDPKDTPQEREQRTIREMALMQLLRHPNICQLREWINEGDYYYMFLEYVDGGQLLDYIINHGKLREKQARKFARQIASALDYCHRNSIVHRDLKIENIMLTRNEDVKIIDFGLSNIYSPSRLLSTFCGSLYFAAPELLRARPYTGPEVDVWSFGVVLYVLVCGRVPFDDTSLPALHAKIKAGQVDGYPEHLSRDCVDLLTRILVVDPKRRATLNQILTHPWMTRGYDEPIVNHLPHRQPIDSIDMDIVQGMRGFGFGEEHEIYARLEKKINDSAYRQAATQIDHNYQQQLMNQDQLSRSRWRLNIRTKRSSVIQDDPLSLPAMYDPLISVYYLVKEKCDYDKRQRHLKRGQQNATTATQSVPTLRRSNSTITPSSRAESGLVRRKTERAPSTSRLDNTSANNTSSVGIARSSSILSRSNSARSMSSTLLARSRSAVRRLGAMLPNTNIHRQSMEDSQSPPPLPTNSPHHHPAASSSPYHQSTDASSSPSNTAKKSTFQQFLKVDPKENNDKPRSSWRRLSISRGSRYTRPSLDGSSSSTTTPTMSKSATTTSAPGRRMSESADRDVDAMSHSSSSGISHHTTPSSQQQPRSLFNFNRRHLYRSTPQKLLDDLANLLWLRNVRNQPSPSDPFALTCECDYPDWTKLLKDEDILEDPTAAGLKGEKILRFTIMVYQARLAGGRLGVKIREGDESPYAKVFRSIGHTLLTELDKTVVADSSR